MTRRLVITLLVLLLSGCGFKLAGTSSLPPELERVHLVASGFNKRQLDVLGERLRRAGAEVSAESDPQAVQLRVRLKILPDRRLVTGADSGKIIERVSRRLDFSVKRADGSLLVDARTLQQQKDIVLDDDNLLSSDIERKNVVEDLELALFNRLIHHLKRL